MKPILYPAGETAFDTNGIGILSDTISCTVTESLNGVYTLEMEYPIDGIHFSEISDSSIILAMAHPSKRLQPFEVYASTSPLNGVVRFYANHISYTLSGEAVDPFTVNSAPGAMDALTSRSVKPHNFTFWTDKQTGAPMTVTHPTAIRSVLAGTKGSILDTYGGEYEFDRYDVKLWTNRGANRGVTIRYGKNLTDITQERNISNVYTCVYPYWMGRDDQLVTLPEKLVDVPGKFAHSKILTLDLSHEFREAPTEDQLRDRTRKYIADNHIGVPDISIALSFVVLSQTEEYKHMALLERVEMGDTVNVEFQKLGISTTAKVVKTVCNSLLERYEKIEVGSVRANIATTIVQQGQQIQQRPTKTDLEKAQEAATAWLTNGKGYKVERRDANKNTVDTLYLDTPDINTAVNVLRLGQSGIGFSKSGVNGPYFSAWTLDGKFSADSITTGTLNAALVKIINLIANVVSSKKDLAELRIDGAELNMTYNGKATISISNEFEGLPIIYMFDIEDGAVKNMSEYSPHHIVLGENMKTLNRAFAISVMPDTGKVLLQPGLDELGKLLEWKDNGDGTYSLIGRDA